MSLHDFGALVTGGSSGLGLTIARRLTTDGMQVAVIDRERAPSDLFSATADVRHSGEVQEGVRLCEAQLGRIDVLVNCAGIGAQGRIEDNPDEEWHAVFDVNVVGIARVTRAALPALRRSPAGSIVNVSSIAATAGLPNRALYSASKGAVLALTRAMAADLLPEGIRVNAVSPGTADTPWISRLLAAAKDPEAERVALEARQPHGRLVTAEEVAGAVAYLASPEAGSTTGISLAVDGGMQELRLRPREPAK
jgi:NAD(P)-dependent dehydrogenase (short-subunit alcohol dehydrogenase family)